MTLAPTNFNSKTATALFTSKMEI